MAQARALRPLLSQAVTAQVNETLLAEGVEAVRDTLLAGSVLAVGVIIAVHDHDGIAAIFVAFAAVMLVLLSLIEPATTEAAGLSRPRTKETDLGRASRGTSPQR